MTSAKEETGNMSTIRRMRKLLPSVKALRSQFESRSASTTNTNRWKKNNLKVNVVKYETNISLYKSTLQLKNYDT